MGGFLGLTVARAVAGGSRYGHLDVQRWRDIHNETGRDLRVFLNGIDVTDRCYEADAGVVRLFKRNEQGCFYVDPETGDAARETLYGRVSVRPQRCRCSEVELEI